MHVPMTSKGWHPNHFCTKTHSFLTKNALGGAKPRGWYRGATQACVVPERHPEERFSPHGPAIKQHMDPAPFLTISSPRAFIFLSNWRMHLKAFLNARRRRIVRNTQGFSSEHDRDVRPRSCKKNNSGPHHHACFWNVCASSRFGTLQFTYVRKTNCFFSFFSY